MAAGFLCAGFVNKQSLTILFIGYHINFIDVAVLLPNYKAMVNRINNIKSWVKQVRHTYDPLLEKEGQHIAIRKDVYKTLVRELEKQISPLKSPLTKQQTHLLNLMKGHYNKAGFLPQASQLAKELGTSTSNYHSRARGLEEKGYIRRPSRGAIQFL